MRLLVGIILGFVISAKVWAADTPEPMSDMRPLTETSVDVFGVLTQLMEAKQAYAAGDYAVAYQGYRYVYLHDSEQSEAKLGYANSALALGQTKQAQKLFRDMQSEDAKTGEILCAVTAVEYAWTNFG